ncbi:MAG: transporter [Janthinobacterium lividum]
MKIEKIVQYDLKYTNAMNMSVRYVLLSCALLAAFSTKALAVDVSPADYTALPAGTTAVLWYQQHGQASQFNTDDGPSYRNDTRLKSDLSILRIVHFTDIAGIRIDPQILLPYGHIYDAKIGGQSLGSARGMGDPLVGATVWLVNQPNAGVSGRYVGITPVVTVPVGSYDRNRSINVGGHRWAGDVQIGWIEPLWGKLAMEWFGDVYVYGNNSEAGTGSQTLKQNASYQIQTDLRYDFNSRQRLAIGFSSSGGGKQYLDGVYTGQKTEVQQIRLEGQQMITARTQIALQLTHDTQVVGGFKNNLAINLRGLILF